MEDVVAHPLEHRPRAFYVGARTADHDGKRRIFCFRDRARHRRVDHGHAVRRERAPHCPRAGRIGGAHVDDERTFAQARHRLEHHFAHHAAVGQHGDEHVRPGHRLARGRGIAVARLVECLQAIAGSGEVGGHRSAHRAEADEGYSFDAKTSFAQRNATTAAGTPQ